MSVKTHSESKQEGKDQQSIQSSTTPDPGYRWESDNVTIRHHKREPICQPFPQGINKQTCINGAPTSPLVQMVGLYKIPLTYQCIIS